MIELTNGLAIEITTASFRVVRGYTVIAALCDEIAFWRSDESANPDSEIIAALKPAMATVPRAMLLCASSPYARRGVLWEAFRRHHGKPSASLVWKADTKTMNPTVPDELIAEAYEADPARAAAEYGAEFRSDIEDFISREVVDAATVAGRHELPPMAGVSYCGFVDPSGGSADSMTLAVAHRDKDGRVVLDAVRERAPPFSPDDVAQEFAALLKSYGIATVRGDQYAGEWPRERFHVHGVAYEPAEKSKSDLYRDALPLLNSGRVELLDIPRLAAQLVGLERRTARGGRDSIDHAPGAHDDVANSVAGALVSVVASATAATLIDVGDFLIDGQPAPMPALCDWIFATLVVNQVGIAGTIYWAANYFVPGPALTLLDFDAGPLRTTLHRDITWRLDDLARQCHARFGSRGILTSSSMSDGRTTESIDDLLANPATLAVAAANQVSGRRVKIAQPAHEKAAHHPLGAALQFRVVANDDPLQLAALTGIVAALGDTVTARAA